MTTLSPPGPVELARPGEASVRAALFGVPSWIWIALVFFVGMSGTLASSAVYHGDERFYTDAALAMERDGTLLVPHYADGSPRLNKPLLTYWLIVASHRVFGVGLYSSRLPFALAGALLIALAGGMASRIFRSRSVGMLTALVLASNPDVLTLATRSTPDILVCVFALLALDGAARVVLEHVVLEGEQRARGTYSFWIGAGLVTAAKGLWGPLLVAFVLIGAWSRPALRARARRLVRLGPALLGLALGAAGVVPLLTAGTNAVLEQSGEDQLRASPSLAVVLHNLAEYGPALLIHLLPWTILLALVLLAREGRELALLRLRTPLARAALAWWAVLVLVFMFGSARRVRYLAPALAPVAIVLAALFCALAARTLVGPWLQRACGSLAALCALIPLALAALLARQEPLAALALAALGGTSAWLAVLTLRREPAAAPQLFGWSALLAALAFIGVLKPTLSHSPLPALVARVEREGSPEPLALSSVPETVAARLRLLSAGRLEPQAIDGAARARGAAPELVLTPAPEAPQWLASGYTQLVEFEALGGPDRGDVTRWWKGESAALQDSAAEDRFVLLRREKL